MMKKILELTWKETLTSIPGLTTPTEFIERKRTLQSPPNPDELERPSLTNSWWPWKTSSKPRDTCQFANV